MDWAMGGGGIYTGEGGSVTGCGGVQRAMQARLWYTGEVNAAALRDGAGGFGAGRAAAGGALDPAIPPERTYATRRGGVVGPDGRLYLTASISGAASGKGGKVTDAG
jgi:hypothetical protein